MNAERSDDKRQFQRILYRAPASLTLADQSFACRVIDLSLKGCLLEFDAAWQSTGNPSCLLNIPLSDELSIEMRVHISRVADHRIGCHCDNIDIDSISELRRLVELNLGDSRLLERDLAALIASAGSAGTV